VYRLLASVVFFLLFLCDAFQYWSYSAINSRNQHGVECLHSIASKQKERKFQSRKVGATKNKPKQTISHFLTVSTPWLAAY
jgi:hypothetical protein